LRWFLTHMIVCLPEDCTKEQKWYTRNSLAEKKCTQWETKGSVEYERASA